MQNYIQKMVYLWAKLIGIVIPAVGGLTGQIPYNVIAKMMKLGYEQIFNEPEKLDWKYAMEIAKRVNE